MKKFISIILSILFFISLLIFTLFYSVQQQFALFDKAHALEFSKEDLEKYSNMNLEELHKNFDEEIVNQGLPTEILDYVVEHPLYEEVVSDFKEDYLDYLKGQKEKPSINQDKINSILNDSVKKYNDENNAQINTEEISFVTDKVSEMLVSVVDTIDDNHSIKKALNFVFNLKYQKYALLATTIILILLLVIQKAKTTLYLIVPFMLNGAFFITLYFIAKSSFLSFIQNILGNTYAKTCSYMLKCGIIYFIISIIFIIVYNVLVNKKAKVKE